ncbi:MAG: hypothetical protein KJ063_15200 [Anaerolineae bacterium]|nr:hypothetical protein [Anaerolineae bacterium]
MNQTTRNRLILISLMLFLLLLAAVTFFVQARQRLSGQVTALEATGQAISQTLDNTEEQLMIMSTVAAARATESANLNDQANALLSQVPTYEARITTLQQQEATLTVRLQEARAETGRLQTEQDRLRQTPPYINFIAPPTGAAYQPGDDVTVVLSASDAYGLVALNVTINNSTWISESYAEPRQLVTLYQVWQPESEGTYTLGVTAINLNGTSSQPITHTINVIDIAQANTALRAQIETNVIALRGLEPLRPITPTLLTQEELRLELSLQLTDGVTEEQARYDVLVLNAFDFVPRDFDYLNFTLDLYSEQVAGFYDPETERFVVISENDVLLGITQQLTHAHEFVHALQDQHFGLGTLGDETFNGDSALAFRSLAEGDASLVELQYVFQYFDMAQIQALLAQVSEQDMTVLEAAPAVLANALLFPYQEGFLFVQALFDLGGFAQVNEAWLNPPTSSEHILHPDRYLTGDMPQTVELLSLIEPLGAGWELLDEDVFGEFFLREYLRQQVDEATAAAAAAGWGGDQYAVYWDDTLELMVMMLRVVWDTEEDAAEFAAAYNLYASQRYDTDATLVNNLTCWSGTVDEVTDLTCLYLEGDETFIIRAPNQAIVQAIMSLHYPAAGGAVRN